MAEPGPGIVDYRLAAIRRRLADRYEFLSLLGRGAAGAVYEVRNLRLGRVEALKVMSEDVTPGFSGRFIHEARMAASLDHPGIVQVYEFGQEDHLCWYSMQFVEGPTLSEVLKAGGSIDEVGTASLAVPLLQALAYSHGRGVIHRDLKPANILIDSQGGPHLTDFGIAKSLDDALKTRTGVVLGTPAYIAPEQASGEPVDERADLYSLGVILYEMLTGWRPFNAENILQAVLLRLHQDPRPVGDLRPGLTPGLAAVVMRALARDREERFSSADEMAMSLIQACESSGIPWDRPSSLAAAALIRRLPLPPVEGGTGLDETTAMGGPSPAAAAEGTDAQAHGRRSRVARLAPWAAAGALVAAGLAWALVHWLRPSAPPPPEPGRASGSRVAKEGTPPAPFLTGSAEGGRQSIDAKGAEASRSGTGTGSQERPGPPIQQATPRQRDAAPAVRRPVIAPVLLESAPPVLQPEAAARCAGQIVNLSVEVGEDGYVKSARVLAGDAGCAQAAREAGMKYSFKPALDAGGNPVEASVAVSVQFPEAP